MAGLLLPICAIFFSGLICCVYFLKKRVNLLENKMYSGMLICTLIDGILVSILHILALNGVNGIENYFVMLFNKIDFLVLILICTFLFFYTLLITIPNAKNKFNNFFLVFLFIDLLAFVLISLLNVDVITESGNFSVGGNAVIFTYIICGFYVLSSILIVLFNIKKVDKRHIPIFAIIFLLGLLFIVFQLNPYVVIISITLTFVDYIMYFTIENPDIKMIEELNIARDSAEKANAAKTDFLSNMSHEIRTPLNAIVGFSNLLLEDKDVPDKAKDEVRDIVMASDNLLEIVNGILDISKIEAGKLEIVSNEYSTKKMLDDLVSLCHGRLGEKPIEFRTNFAPDLPPVLYGDASRIKQICVNILTNAIKYTKEGWIEFKISVVKKDNICRLIISVEDTGIGIKEQNIDKLFNKFERLDLEENITIEGTGLGLAITKKLVDLMHGKIVVQSVFGKGSKFTVCIDQRIVENPTIKLETEKNVDKVKVTNKKVLLVDDNKINLKVAEKLLYSYGIEVESVESGFACLDKINEGNKYDLIMLDDMMPKMSGVETLKKLKDIPGFDIKTIALTANALTGMREKYLSDGFDDYLAKPINKDELNKIINKYLNDD